MFGVREGYVLFLSEKPCQSLGAIRWIYNGRLAAHGHDFSAAGILQMQVLRIL